MHETSKSVARRLRDVAYVRWLAGNGIDVGCGKDPLSRWRGLFPLMGEVRDWDRADGDAQALAGLPAASFSWLHSSHCLEHLRDPFDALRNWCRVVEPKGHLVILVPDEDMYEQGVWPSRYNADHRHSFTLYKASSWSPASINVFSLLASVADLAIPIRVELLESTFCPNRTDDQTITSVTESAIEFVLRRLPG